MTETNPWKIVAEKPVYENNWISVTEFDVINPNGGKGIYGKVHFKNVAVGIIPMDEEQNIYLVGQYRFTLNAFSWEIPEGGGRPDENTLDAAKRELLEETGLLAEEWTPILQMHLSNSVSDEYAVMYLARKFEQHAPMPEETEQLSVKKIPLDEACRMVKEGEITDSMTVATLLRVKLMLLNKEL